MCMGHEIEAVAIRGSAVVQVVENVSISYGWGQLICRLAKSDVWVVSG